MKGIADESVGENFSLEKLQRARDLTLAVIEEAALQMQPGMTEKDAQRVIQLLQTQKGALKSWHPPQIRFGENTLLPFGARGKDGVRLREDDIFFFDLGPIFDGHEGDVGRAFVLGKNDLMAACACDVAKIWNEVRFYWKTENISGRQLYDFAEESSRRRGWILTRDEANGHRIADFPHAARQRGSIDAFPANPAENRWILEIQIRHPSLPFGAFYEDLLN